MREDEYLTKEKFQELKEELEHLKRDKRKEIAEHLEYARSLGDLSENAEYHEAREEQANVEDRIMRLEALLKSAKIISSSSHNDQAMVGSIVVVKKEKESDSTTYTLVGSEEADMSTGKISVKSPFGSAILGKKKGQVFNFQTPQGEVRYKVMDIK